MQQKCASIVDKYSGMDFNYKFLLLGDLLEYDSWASSIHQTISILIFFFCFLFPFFLFFLFLLNKFFCCLSDTNLFSFHFQFVFSNKTWFFSIERDKWLPWKNKKYLSWNQIKARGVKLEKSMAKHCKKRHTKGLSLVPKIQSRSRD